MKLNLRMRTKLMRQKVQFIYRPCPEGWLVISPKNLVRRLGRPGLPSLGNCSTMSNSHRSSTIPSLASIPQTDARRIVDPSPSSSPRYRPSFIIFSIYSFLRPPSRPRETFLPPCPVRAQSHGMWVMCISVCPAITRKNGSSRREGPRASGPGPPRRTISPSWSTPAPERYAHQSHRSIIYLVSTKENHS